MFVFDTLFSMNQVGQRVPRWQLKVEISAIGGDPERSLQFLIDTGSMYTVVPMYFAKGIGLEPSSVRRSGKHVEISTASGGRLDAYLFEVQLRFEDQYSGIAEWDTKVAFCDRVKDGYAGRSGFLEYLRFADQVLRFSLDPIAGTVGSFQCGSGAAMIP